MPNVPAGEIQRVMDLIGEGRHRRHRLRRLQQIIRHEKKRHRRKANAEVNLGFQIAPMIDVVFVIMLFFMVMASDVQVENAHNTKLPGTVESDHGNRPAR